MYYAEAIPQQSIKAARFTVNNKKEDPNFIPHTFLQRKNIATTQNCPNLKS